MVKRSKKNKGKNKKRKHRKKRSFPLFKYMIVMGLWGLLSAFFLTLWYAKDLHSVIDSANFERKTSITFIDRHGETIARYGGLQGQQVAVFDLPSHAIHAILATEDRRFYSHKGVDPLGIMRAMAVNLKAGRTVQGGSTLTQQLAKNLFLSHERSIKRKVQELILSLWLEQKFTKDEILTAYINRVYFGSGAYGIDAAAKVYYNKSSTKLTLKESAMIAGLLKAPSRYSPHNNPELANKRAKVVLGAMVDAGYITQKQADDQNLSVSPAPKIKVQSDSQTERYFTDWLMDQLPNKIGSINQNIIVETTLDLGLQKKLEKELKKAMIPYQNRAVSQGALLLINYDGEVIAMIGGKDYKDSQFNRTTQALRQPGSAFKPFVYLTAFEKGWNPDDIIVDKPMTIADYTPRNFDNEFKGKITLEEAFIDSRNIPALKLTEKVGLGAVIEMAQKHGISSPVKREIGLALGASETRLIELTNAYAIIARKGKAKSLYGIEKIYTETEDEIEVLYKNKSKTSRVAKSKNYASLIDLMTSVVNEGTGKAAKQKFPLAGKTGTSEEYRDAWFVGFSSDYIAGIWVGNDDNTPMNGITGGSLPATLFAHTMKTAHGKDLGGNLGNDFDPSGFFQNLLESLSEANDNEKDRAVGARPSSYNQ